MDYRIRQISSMEKVRGNDQKEYPEIFKRTVIRGERVSYQIVLNSPERSLISVKATSPFGDNLKLYKVKEVPMDVPVTVDAEGEDYITLKPSLMPEILIPLEETNMGVMSYKYNQAIRVSLDIPKDFEAGTYEITLKFTAKVASDEETESVSLGSKKMTLEVISEVIPEQKLIYTRWFYADCIADIHNVEIYSEKHWDLIEKYIKAATNVGINMILVPIHTPPLDTAIGSYRPCVQLVDIEKKGDSYYFDFKKFHRFIAICKNNGIKYFEMAHMFSQWGAKYSPNIKVTENGKTDYMFGWHISSTSEEYVSFLKQYIKALSKELEKEGILENTYFHISDEPTEKNIASYEEAKNIIKPLIGKGKTFDALSHADFYKKGLVECPVTAVNNIKEFLELDVPNQWVYYCCGPQVGFLNSFMAMPLYRVRVLGFLLYKYNIKGFLHWGFNFYNAERSDYRINPYLTTGADGAFPSGDAFIVYPGENTVYSSIRGEATFEAIQDMDIAYRLEELIGRDEVIKMIDDWAGMDLHFDNYPKDSSFLENLREAMIKKISEL